MAHSVQRLGSNKGGYLGETIDIQQVLRADLAAARQFGWQIEEIPVSDGLDLLAFRRAVKASRKNLYLSAGIHGDEPAGPLAVRQLLEENEWPDDVNIWVCPCLNPTGFPLNRRENVEGIDLNRDYLHLRSAEIRSHVAWLNQQPNFNLTLCLHEDWESHGFYLYEVNPDHEPSLGEKVMQAVSMVCPIDLSAVIEDRPAQGGIIRPDIDPAKRPQWPEAYFLVRNKTRHCYTLEAPSDFPLPTRVAALVTAVRVVLNAL